MTSTNIDIDHILAGVLENNEIYQDDNLLCTSVLKAVNTKIRIKIEGQNYHSSFPSTFAQSLIEIQDNFYRAISIAIYGEENLKRMNSDLRNRYLLTFVIQSGCTETEADFKKSLVNLVHDAMKDMPPKMKIILLATIAIIATGGVIAWKYLETSSENEKEVQQTARLNHAIDKLAENNEKNTIAVLRGVRDADSVEINDRKYNRQEIIDANQRAQRIPYEAQDITASFRIFGVDTKQQTINKFTLSSPKTGEFPALFDEDLFDQDDIDKIWDAVKNKKEITLSLNLDKQENKIKQSTITAIH